MPNLLDQKHPGGFRILVAESGRVFHTLPDGTVWPCGKRAAELADECRTGAPTDSQWQEIVTILEAYYHLVDHPAGTESAIGSLRLLRRAERLCPVSAT